MFDVVKFICEIQMDTNNLVERANLKDAQISDRLFELFSRFANFI